MAKIFNKNKCLPLFLAMAAASAQAQWSPSRPVRLIVPFPPGGAVDVVGRIAAARMPERLGQQVVVDNRGGAYAIIGTELGAKAAPDGHTILIVAAGHTITPSVIKKLPYDPVKDFAAIGFIGSGVAEWAVRLMGRVGQALSAGRIVLVCCCVAACLSECICAPGGSIDLRSSAFSAPPLE